MATKRKSVIKVKMAIRCPIPEEENQAPVLDDLDNQDAHPQMPVAFTATASDPEGDPLTFGLTNNPPNGATMDGDGNFSWTPTWAQLGAHSITVRVVDTDGLSDTKSCIIAVRNLPPVLDNLDNLEAHPETPVAFTASANDNDGDALTFELINNPPTGAVMDGAGNFSWTPTWAQLGAHTITVRVTDPGGLSDTRSCIITVKNDPPELDDLDNQDAHPDMPVAFTANAADPDGDALTFSLINNPPTGAAMDAWGNFTWTPTWAQLGAHTITVRVVDPAGLSSVKSCIIIVKNDSPDLDDLDNQSAETGEEIAFTATATDPDDDALTFSLINNPPLGASIDGDGNFSWTPNQAGAFTITVRVSDPGGLSSVKSCIIIVTDP